MRELDSIYMNYLESLGHARKKAVWSWLNGRAAPRDSHFYI